MPDDIDQKYAYADFDNYLWVLIERTRSIIMRSRELELAQYGFTVEQMSILHTLMLNGGSATIDEIAGRIIRQKNSVTTLVDRMSRAGLVKKEKSKLDKKYRISLTEKAQYYIDILPRKSIGMVFAGMSDADKHQMAQSMEYIISTGLELLGHNYVPPFLQAKTNGEEKPAE